MSSVRKLADAFLAHGCNGPLAGSDCSAITLPYPFVRKNLTLFVNRRMTFEQLKPTWRTLPSQCRFEPRRPGGHCAPLGPTHFILGTAPPVRAPSHSRFN